MLRQATTHQRPKHIYLSWAAHPGVLTAAQIYLATNYAL